MKLVANSQEPPLASLIATKLLEPVEKIDIEWNPNSKSSTDCKTFDSDVSACRYLAEFFSSSKLYGASLLEHVEVDHWIAFGIGPLQNYSNLSQNLVYLDRELSTVTYLVGEEISIADIIVWCQLFKYVDSTNIVRKQFPNVHRWYSFMESQSCVRECLRNLPANIQTEISKKVEQVASESNPTEKRDEGKFIELPGAEMGKVVVRFPPEASGYLHIGHAKAALLNQHYKDKFAGKLVMRFDDTNPAKEKVDFEKVILEDLEMLQVKPDIFTHTSDYFDLMLQYCEKLLNEGRAYVDDTDPEVMKNEREKKVESKHRNNPVAVNFKMWKEMLGGTEFGKKCCVRAKIDMNSANGCMRDPTIYRCKPESHPKTGNKYKVYPTYDFACPIVDSIEGVTHCLRTTEYHDRDDQFYWFIDALELRKPYIWEYSRLNMTNTVLSKRKLTWFVEEGLVDGWDDPRFPTVRGILRRGMTVAGLTQFIIAQGSSRSVVSMEWDKIWAFNKKVIDPIAPRYNALESSGTVPVLVDNVKTEKVPVPKHPKNEDVGLKSIWKSNRLLIDSIDAEALKENENATFINWGNLLITKINRDGSKITSIQAKENTSNTDFKKTLKLTWLSDIAEAPFVPCVCVYFDHIITKPVLSKDEDFKNFINPNTKIEKMMLGDPELVNVKKGDIIQLQRRGFYICDQEYQPASLYSSNVVPIILFFIPDGHTKETAITVQSIKNSKDDVCVKKDAKVAVGETSKKKVDKQKQKKTTNVSSSSTAEPIVTDSKTIDELTKLLDSIKNQGDRVRQLKADKAEKDEVDNEVNILKKLKESFKALSKIEWKQGLTIDQIAVSAPGDSTSSLNGDASADDLYQRVCLQTSKYRFMELKKVDKNRINTEVTLLADLKEQYKSLTGKEWILKEGHNIDNLYDTHISKLYGECVDQGTKVRQLKSQKVNESIINAEVKKLLDLKAKYKEASGLDYKPPDPKSVSTASAASASSNSSSSTASSSKMSNEAVEIHTKIVEQGNKVRTLKAEKSPKEVVDNEVKILLSLKEEFKKASGIDWTPKLNIQDGKVVAVSAKPAEKPVTKKKTQPESVQTKKPSSELAASSSKKQTRLGLEAKKDENLSEWYTQVITKGELIDYYDVSGCYILRPWAFAIWKAIRNWFEQEIAKLGVDECYFPIFVSKHALEKEKTHIADFAPEVAWVTKSGESDLEEPVAIRPTSETVMYPAYAKWIRSHRDLPLKLNQWNNVVRWEFKHPQPFLRTREFLWQEGHTAYATREEAEQEVYVILDLYAKIYTDLLAVPVIKGRKTEKEKFAGGDFTTTVEAFISASGRGIQGGTSHHLGQNFSKMFDIVFEDAQVKQFVFQNSWGLTTRTIGVMIMVHADDQGLVLPPRVAKIQVVIVPCGISANMKNEDRQSLENSCSALESTLSAAGIRVLHDARDNYTTGWKFNDWELKGVPLRLELGPKDIKQNQVVAVRRDTGEKLILSRDSIATDVEKTLGLIQQSLFDKADKDLKSHTVVCEDWSLFAKKLNEKNIILSPFCGEVECEDKIKQDSARNENADPGAPSMGAKSLCIPFDQPKAISPSTLCIHPACGKPAKFYTLFGRSY